MSAARRAARRERQAADLLGTKRVHRSRYERAPDVEPVVLPCGARLSVEVKTRAKLPALVTKALAQAEGYGARGDIPAAVLSATGGEPVIALPLRAFRRLVGLEVAAPLPLFAGMGEEAREKTERELDVRCAELSNDDLGTVATFASFLGSAPRRADVDRSRAIGCGNEPRGVRLRSGDQAATCQMPTGAR